MLCDFSFFGFICVARDWLHGKISVLKFCKECMYVSYNVRISAKSFVKKVIFIHCWITVVLRLDYLPVGVCLKMAADKMHKMKTLK